MVLKSRKNLSISMDAVVGMEGEGAGPFREPKNIGAVYNWRRRRGVGLYRRQSGGPQCEKKFSLLRKDLNAVWSDVA